MFRSKKLSQVKEDVNVAVFQAASKYAKAHPELSGADKVKLQLYGLFKVATKGKMPTGTKAPSKLAFVEKVCMVIYSARPPLFVLPRRTIGVVVFVVLLAALRVCSLVCACGPLPLCVVCDPDLCSPSQ